MSKYQWRNVWCQSEWKDLPEHVTTLDAAGREMQSKMPYTEDGTQVREVESGDVYNWKPPRNEINFGL